MKKSEEELVEEQLRKQLDKIIEDKLKRTIKVNYPIFKKVYEGKYFKIINGYSGSKKWWLYTKVTEIKPSHIYIGLNDIVLSHYNGFSFETCSDKTISIQHKYGCTHSLGKEISEKEFNEAWNKMIDNINKLK